MLLSSAIGYGLLSARPAAGSAGRLYYATDTSLLYRDNGSAWDTLTFPTGGGGHSALLLDYTETSELANNTAFSAATWTSVGTARSFTVGNASSVVEFFVNVGMQLASADGAEMSSSLLIDSTTRYYLGSNVQGASGRASNPFAGAGPVAVTGLAAGNHTVVPQFYSGTGGHWWLQASTSPALEHYRVQVLERLPA